MGWVYLYSGVQLDYDDFKSLKSNEGYDIYEYITEVNTFLNKNNSKLNLIDAGDEPVKGKIVIGYNIDGEEVNNYSTSSFSTELPKFNTFKEFKSDIEMLKDHLDTSKIIKDNYMLHVVYCN